MSFREFHLDRSQNPQPFGKTWIVEAPWAHPIWANYVVLLYDLTTDTGSAPTTYREGMTHELMVFALDPSKPIEPPNHMLRPANHGYQFEADSDEAAVERVVKLLEEIEAKQLSPDTDFRTMWDVRFSDGVSLHMRGGAA